MMSKGLVDKILVYVDGTEGCIAAAQFGIALAKRTGAELIALYVVNVSLLEELTKARIFVKIEEMDYEQDLEQDGRRYLNYIAQLAQNKGQDLRTELSKGVVNKQVVEKIHAWDIDLLIMGELEPVLSRSDTYHDEAELIFRKAKCSVLVVKDLERMERLYETLE